MPRLRAGTGCGDYLLSGWTYRPFTEGDYRWLQGLKLTFLNSVMKAPNSVEFDVSGIIFYAILSEHPDQKHWVDELHGLGFRVGARGINSVHFNANYPLVLMHMHTGTAPKRAKAYWEKPYYWEGKPVEPKLDHLW